MLLLALCFAVSAGAEGVSAQITYAELYGKSLRITADVTETAHARYFFAHTLPADEREACIRHADALLCQLPITQQPEICLMEASDFDGVRIDGHRLYLAPMDWNSADFAALVLQAAAGEYSHYGLAYGLANMLLGHDGAFVCPEQSAVFDLNLLCFDPAFVAQADADAARACHCVCRRLYGRPWP